MQVVFYRLKARQKVWLFVAVIASCVFALIAFSPAQAAPRVVEGIQSSPGPSEDGPSKLIHPGIFHTERDLERVRANVAAGKQPWKSAWEALRHSGPGLDSKANLSDASTNPYAIQNDGHTAYVLTIMWAASGDPAYAKAAMGIIDSWTSGVNPVTPHTMRNGLGGSQMANAAEILAYGFHGAAGWPSENIVRAKKWFKDVVYPHISTGKMRSANWGTSSMAGCMSIAVFCDDLTMYRDTLSAYRHGFTNTNDGECGITQYIDRTGENAESGRDQPHSQGGIAHLMEVAVIAFNQGNPNLLRYADDRIVVGFEYTAKYNLGQDVPYHPFTISSGKTIYPNGISTKGRGNFSPVYQMAHYYFSNAGFTAPYTGQVCKHPGYAPEGCNSDHVGLGTLMFSTE